MMKWQSGPGFLFILFSTLSFQNQTGNIKRFEIFSNPNINVYITWPQNFLNSQGVIEVSPIPPHPLPWIFTIINPVRMPATSGQKWAKFQKYINIGLIRARNFSRLILVSRQVLGPNETRGTYNTSIFTSQQRVPIKEPEIFPSPIRGICELYVI